MISGLFKFIFYILLYLAVFVGLVWILLGMSPIETYDMALQNLTGVRSRTDALPAQMEAAADDLTGAVTDDVRNTESDLKSAVDPDMLAQDIRNDIAD